MEFDSPPLAPKLCAIPYNSEWDRGETLITLDFKLKNKVAKGRKTPKIWDYNGQYAENSINLITIVDEATNDKKCMLIRMDMSFEEIMQIASNKFDTNFKIIKNKYGATIYDTYSAFYSNEIYFA